ELDSLLQRGVRLTASHVASHDALDDHRFAPWLVRGFRPRPYTRVAEHDPRARKRDALRGRRSAERTLTSSPPTHGTGGPGVARLLRPALLREHAEHPVGLEVRACDRAHVGDAAQAELLLELVAAHELATEGLLVDFAVHDDGRGAPLQKAGERLPPIRQRVEHDAPEQDRYSREEAVGDAGRGRRHPLSGSL